MSGDELLNWHRQQAQEIASTVLRGSVEDWAKYKYLVGRYHAHLEALEFAASEKEAKQ